MKISSSFDNCYNQKYNQPFKRKFYLPEKVGEMGKFTNEHVGIAEEKLFLASSACILQPLVDIIFADEDKRSDVAIKSVSKALAGGITGVTIRGGLNAYLKSKIKFDTKNTWCDYFFPLNANKMRDETSKTLAKNMLKQYCSTLSGIFALLIMALITNEKIDVPLTMLFQDFFTDFIQNDLSLKDSLINLKKSCSDKVKNAYYRTIRFWKQSKEKKRIITEIIKDDKIKIPRERKLIGESVNAA